MKNVLVLLALLAAWPAWAYSTGDEYQPDFEKARECKPIDGRKVWAGKDAYYIQANMFQTGQSGLLDDDAVSTVPIKDNDKVALEAFEKACN